jgi:aldose 1-epimerase
MTLLIVYTGKSDKDTVFSPTNHSYFNLAGEDSGSTKNQLLYINADQITNKAEDNVPDGTFSDVVGTVFDFTVPSPIGQTIGRDHPQLVTSRGMDQNFCLKTGGDVNTISAILNDPSSGRKIEVLTNFPGIQIYSGNHLEGSLSKSGGLYVDIGGVCLETQLFPDAMHHANFPSAIIPANKRVCYLTGYRFSAK